MRYTLSLSSVDSKLFYKLPNDEQEKIFRDYGWQIRMQLWSLNLPIADKTHAMMIEVSQKNPGPRSVEDCLLTAQLVLGTFLAMYEHEYGKNTANGLIGAVSVRPGRLDLVEDRVEIFIY